MGGDGGREAGSGQVLRAAEEAMRAIDTKHEQASRPLIKKQGFQKKATSETDPKHKSQRSGDQRGNRPASWWGNLALREAETRSLLSDEGEEGSLSTFLYQSLFLATN